MHLVLCLEIGQPMHNAIKHDFLILSLKGYLKYHSYQLKGSDASHKKRKR